MTQKVAIYLENIQRNLVGIAQLTSTSYVFEVASASEDITGQNNYFAPKQMFDDENTLICSLEEGGQKDC